MAAKFSFLCCCLLLAVGCSAIHIPVLSLHPERDWSMFGRNPGHTNYVGPSTFVFPLSLLWKYDASAGYGVSAMTVVDGILIVGTLQGELHAVDALTGKRIGYKKFSYPIGGTPIIFRQFAYFGLEGGKESFVAFNLAENKVEWTAAAGTIDSSPLLFDERLYAGSTNGTLYCLELAKGEEVWKFETKAPIHASPSADDSLVVFANDDGTIYALNASNGSERWRYRTGMAVFGSPMIIGRTVFVGSRDHYLYALDLARGTLRWKFDAGEKIVASPSADDSIVFIGALDGTLTALNQKTGSVVWKFKTNSVINSSPAVTSASLFVGSLNTELYALSPLDGKVLWKQKLGARVKTSPVVWNNLLYIAAEDRTIYCYHSAEVMQNH